MNLNEIILNNYQIRKTYKQKTQFINFLENRYKNIPITIEKSGKLIKNRNIIIGDFKHADIVYSAHYDTCAFSFVPNMMFKSKILFVLYQIIFLTIFCFVSYILTVVLKLLIRPADVLLLLYLVWGTLLYQLMFGIKNNHTANDNTSGVLTILYAIDKIIKVNGTIPKNICFVLFDNEEKGLIGSQRMKTIHKTDDKIFFNFDCVGNGNNLILFYKKPMKNNKIFNEFYNKAKNISPSHFDTSSKKLNSLMLSSDHIVFKNSIGIATFKKNKIFKFLYVPRLHTPLDTKYSLKNIKYLSNIIYNFVINIESGYTDNE